MENDATLRRWPLMATAFESGVLLAMLWKSKNRDTLMPIIEQLQEHVVQMRTEAGATITDLGDGVVQITDKSGITLVRPKHPWEK